MNQPEIISALELFIEKADKLLSSNFAKNVTKNSGFDLKWKVGETVQVKRRGPDRENIEAFVLTFRYFIQDNESISMRNFAQMYSSPVFTKKENEDFKRAREALNKFLDGFTMLDIGGRISRRKLMDTFVYGGLSHANPEKKKEYDSWVNDTLVGPICENEFVVTLYEVLNIIAYVKNLSIGALERIKI